jgi:hypothetical protein
VVLRVAVGGAEGVAAAAAREAGNEKQHSVICVLWQRDAGQVLNPELQPRLECECAPLYSTAHRHSKPSKPIFLRQQKQRLRFSCRQVVKATRNEAGQASESEEFQVGAETRLRICRRRAAAGSTPLCTLSTRTHTRPACNPPAQACRRLEGATQRFRQRQQQRRAARQLPPRAAAALAPRVSLLELLLWLRLRGRLARDWTRQGSRWIGEPCSKRCRSRGCRSSCTQRLKGGAVRARAGPFETCGRALSAHRRWGSNGCSLEVLRPLPDRAATDSPVKTASARAQRGALSVLVLSGGVHGDNGVRLAAGGDEKQQ